MHRKIALLEEYGISTNELVEMAFRYRDSNGSDDLDDYLWEHCPPEPSLAQGCGEKYHSFISNSDKLLETLKAVTSHIWHHYEVAFDSLPEKLETITVTKVGAEDTCVVLD